MNTDKMKTLLLIANSSKNEVSEDIIDLSGMDYILSDKSIVEIPVLNHKDKLLANELIFLSLVTEDGSCTEISESNFDSIDASDGIVVLLTKGVYRNREIAESFYRCFTSEEERNKAIIADPYMHWCVVVNTVLNESLDDFIKYRTYWSDAFFNMCRMRGLTIKETLDAYKKHIE